MKKLFIAVSALIVLIIIVLIILISTNQKPHTNSTSQTSSPTGSHITFPVGGETFSKGQVITLKWTGGQDPIQISLIDQSLETQGTTSSMIDKISGIKNTGSFGYKIPNTLKDGTYKFEVGDMTSAYFKVSKPISDNFCNPSQLQAQISTEGAAGSIYINATLKNVSKSPCDILGGSFILATFNTTIRNISQVHQGKASTQTITLPAGKTLYAQLRAQNGPQCSGQPKQTPVDFVYEISPDNTLVFNGPNNQSLLLQSCTNPQEITRIDISPLSNTPTK